MSPEKKSTTPPPQKTGKKPLFRNPFLAVYYFVRNVFAATQNVVGIDAGYAYVKLVQQQKGRRGYTINLWFTRSIPPAIRDNPQERRIFVQTAIREFIEASPLKAELGRLVISGKGIYILSFSLPALNKKDLKGAVNIELRKRLPLQQDSGSVASGFFITDQFRDERTLNFQLTCIACDRAVIDEQIQMLKEVNIRPQVVNCVPDAIGNLVSACVSTEAGKVIAVLDMGASASALNFYKDQILLFSREVPVGGEALTKALSRTVTTEYGPVEIPPDEAEKIKRNCGIPLADDAKVEYLSDVVSLKGEQIATLMRPVLERMVMEVNRTLSYFSKAFRQEKPVDELYVTGGSAGLRNLQAFLQYNIQGMKKVEILDAMQAIRGWSDKKLLHNEMAMEQAALYMAPVFGACLKNGGMINLVPQKEKVEQTFYYISSVATLVIVLLVGISLFFSAFQWGNILNYQKSMGRLDDGLGRLQSIIVRIKEYQTIKGRLEQCKELVEKSKGRQPYWYGIYKELSLITPGDVALNKVTMETKDPKDIRLHGRIISKFTVVDVALYQYVTVLEESPFFKNVTLASRKDDQYSATPAAYFEIVCQLAY